MLLGVILWLLLFSRKIVFDFSQIQGLFSTKFLDTQGISGMDSISESGFEIGLVAVCSFNFCAIIGSVYHVGR